VLTLLEARHAALRATREHALAFPDVRDAVVRRYLQLAVERREIGLRGNVEQGFHGATKYTCWKSSLR
jgi:hypothetical protein